ncbi:MAG: hypothetical protein ACK5R0_12725 [Bacteroidota bacterium]|jgi:hypothetical protein
MGQIGKFLTAIVIGCTLGQGCKKDSISPYDYGTFLKCHNKGNWDLESTKNKIIGLWEWKYIKCCGGTANPYENESESKGLKIEFKKDGTGILIDNDAIGEFKWDIGTYNVFFSFTTDPPIPQIIGQLLFCDDIMMCNASYKDGADNFFKKLN